MLVRAGMRAAASGAQKKLVVNPRNAKQIQYIRHLEDVSKNIVIASGHAGCGKSMIATTIGINKMKSGEVKKIVLTRPAVSVEEQHGFLPGTIEQKMEPWTRPLFDVLDKHFTVSDIEAMMHKRVIEICPLAFMRGRTFEDAWIICDEAQNCTPNQMLMVLTRIGNNSKIVVTGDPFQHDRGFEENGLSDLVSRVQGMDSDHISVVEFEQEDVERHPIIPHILNMYGS